MEMLLSPYLSLNLNAYLVGLGPPFSFRAGTSGGGPESLYLHGFFWGGGTVSSAFSMYLTHQLSKRGSLSPVSQMRKPRGYTESLRDGRARGCDHVCLTLKCHWHHGAPSSASQPKRKGACLGGGGWETQR